MGGGGAAVPASLERVGAALCAGGVQGRAPVRPALHVPPPGTVSGVRGVPDVRGAVKSCRGSAVCRWVTVSWGLGASTTAAGRD